MVLPYLVDKTISLSTRIPRSLQLTGHLKNCKNTEGPVSLVMELHITHTRWGSIFDPSINGHLHYPNGVDRPQNEDVTDKLEYTVNLYSFYFYKIIGKLTVFLQFQEFNLHNLLVDSSTSTARRSPHTSKPKRVTSSPRMKFYMGLLFTSRFISS
jgi:hypothetical protein